MTLRGRFRLSQNSSSLFGLIIIVALIVALSLPLKNQLTKSKLDSSPDWYMTGVSSTTYDKQGQINAILTTPSIVHFNKGDYANLTKPFFTLLDKNKVPWQISAAYGKFYQGKKERFFLWDKVIVKQLPGVHSSQTKLTTSELTYYPKTSVAHTDKAVTITQPGSIMHSVGFNADLKKGLIEFLSQSTAEYSNEKSK